MNDNTLTLEDLSIPMAITQQVLQTAMTFAQQQPTPSKAKQVYLNTLAVYLVHNYLQILGIKTNLNRGDSWNGSVRFALDVADLEVTNIGRLECRPFQGEINPNATCFIPPEVHEDRIGYIVVNINEQQQEAALLGFAKTVINSKLSLSQLQPIDDLPEYLYSLKESQQSLTHLSQWLEGIFQEGWQAIEEGLLKFNQPELAFRSLNQTIERVKSLQLTSDQSVILKVTLKENKHDLDLTAELYPSPNQDYLPSHLEFSLLDEGGEKVMTAETREENQNIQFEFSGKIEDKFSLKILFNEVVIIQNFRL